MNHASDFPVSSFYVNFFSLSLPSLAALGWYPFLLRTQSGFAWNFFYSVSLRWLAVVIPPYIGDMSMNTSPNGVSCHGRGLLCY